MTGTAAQAAHGWKIDGQDQDANGDHPKAQHRQDRKDAANQERDAERDAQRLPTGQRDFVLSEAQLVAGDDGVLS